jgi:hypothetical protein
MPAMDVKTQLQIVAFGTERMRMFDTDSGEMVVDCNRNPDGTWTITADGVPDVTVPPDIQPGPTYRGGAITAMAEQALTASPGEGYSILVPHGLPETP